MAGDAFPFPNPVESPDQLFDRVEEVTQICAELPHRTVVILGGRLMGKTSLLNVVARWAEEQPSFAVIRLAHVRSREQLMREILHGIYDWVVRHHPDAVRGDPAFTESTVARFTSAVAQLSSHAPGVHFLLCVDEFDALLAGCDAAEARHVLDLIRHLATVPNQPIRLLFTMLRIPEELKRSYGSPFLSEARFVSLRSWPRSEAVAYADWLLGERLRLMPEAHEALFTAAGGHPYFTKAVLHAVLTRPEGSPTGEVLPGDIAPAVRDAVSSLEVDFALSNLVGVHLSERGVETLDLAAKSTAGITPRSVGNPSDADRVLRELVDAGLMTADRNRYHLALGLWRQWRRGTPGRRRARRIGQAVTRVLMRRAVTGTLIGLLIAMILVLAFGAAFLQPRGTKTLKACPGGDVTVRAAYPSYLSSGDEHELQLVVVNTGQVDSLNGSMVLAFPDEAVTLHTDNAIRYERLDPGEQRTQVIHFTSNVPASLFASGHSGVPVRLVSEIDGVSCAPQEWSLGVAPIPYLKALQKAAGALVGLVLIPLGIELVLARRARRRRRVNPSAG